MALSGDPGLGWNLDAVIMWCPSWREVRVDNARVIVHGHVESVNAGDLDME